MKAVLLIRIMRGAHNNIETRQKAAMESYCDEHNIVNYTSLTKHCFANAFEDAGCRNEVRLFALAEKADVIVIESISRFFTKVSAFQSFVSELAESNIRLVVVTQRRDRGKLNTSELNNSLANIVKPKSKK